MPLPERGRKRLHDDLLTEDIWCLIHQNRRGDQMDSAVAGSFRIGVDIGGTFTDVSIVDSAGEVHATKSPSVPSDPARGVIEALHHAAAQLDMRLPALLSRTSLFVHGSTIATNTLLERTGAVVGLLGTDGFRDTIEIRRGW